MCLQVSELNAKLQACHHVLVSYPCLDSSPKEQKEMMELRKNQLKEKWYDLVTLKGACLECLSNKKEPVL